jgi:hypothetical protein
MQWSFQGGVGGNRNPPAFLGTFDSKSATP